VVGSLDLNLEEPLEEFLEELLEMAVQDSLVDIKLLMRIPWSNWSSIWKPCDRNSAPVPNKPPIFPHFA